MYKRIREITRQEMCSLTGCIKISELFHKKRGKLAIHRNMEGSDI